MIGRILATARPDFTDGQLDRFETYYAMLADWNTRVNLTAITDPEGVAKKHFLDSLAAEPYLKQDACIADVGTGAGFPGVPLMILRPDLKVTLMDSLQKRLAFLETLLKELALDAELVHARAEDAGQNPRYRETFDAALTRAVAGLPALCELTLPLVKTGGISVAYKADATQELEQAQHALSILHATARRIEIPSDYGARELVILTKLAPTPKQYPRKAGTPAKNPL